MATTITLTPKEQKTITHALDLFIKRFDSQRNFLRGTFGLDKCNTVTTSAKKLINKIQGGK